MTDATTTAPTASNKIVCQIDGALCHSIELYIREHHKDWTIEQYREKFPDAPLMSEYAKEAVRRSRRERAAREADAAITRRPMDQVFGVPTEKVKNPRGEVVQVRVFSKADLVNGDDSLVPEVDDNYVFPIKSTYDVLMGLEFGLTIYNWGLHGSGKTTLFEQIAARTGRPFLRIQHTLNTEESHILGQYTARGGEVTFNLGPLPLAMLNGWMYCADEYDAAVPAVSLLYQPVLEGKPLFIKDAPPEMRLIKPHPNFRFVATGNTNGSGDETGLYQGTQIQNAANYSRFNITIETDYPEAKIEQALLAKQTGCKLHYCQKLVEFANSIREAFKSGKISATISPRELITATKVSLIRGGNWHLGIALAFANRLSTTDREVVNQLVQRYFGNAAAA